MRAKMLHLSGATLRPDRRRRRHDGRHVVQRVIVLAVDLHLVAEIAQQGGFGIDDSIFSASVQVRVVCNKYLHDARERTRNVLKD
jgi:hypothetical protein